MNPIIYLDEAGYTGADVLNLDQSHFVLASVYLSDEDIDAIFKDLNGNEELHFKELKKSEEGQEKILQVLKSSISNKQQRSLLYS